MIAFFWREGPLCRGGGRRGEGGGALQRYSLTYNLLPGMENKKSFSRKHMTWRCRHLMIDKNQAPPSHAFRKNFTENVWNTISNMV